jgi:uncharacterized protein
MRPISISISLAAILLAGLAGYWLLAGKAGPALVVDDAGLMSDAQRIRLAEYHAYLLDDHGIDYRVVTTPEAGDINVFAVERFEALGVGSRSEGARGLLLVIDPDRNQVRLEVGYALEGVFPDAFIGYVEQRQMVPFFQAGRVADGILAATELIVTRAQRAAANAGFEGEAWMAGSGGAGATSEARLGEGWQNPVAEAGGAAEAGGTPEETLGRYLAAMAARDGSPGLGIYTPETRRMLQDWVMTPAQMTNVAKAYGNCQAEPARLGPAGRLAVIRYPAAERQCAPWFFRRVDGTWALDLTMMQTVIRFGRTNAWHFDLAATHPYDFAFEDWRFASKGFPIAE